MDRRETQRLLKFVCCPMQAIAEITNQILGHTKECRRRHIEAKGKRLFQTTLTLFTQ